MRAFLDFSRECPIPCARTSRGAYTKMMLPEKSLQGRVAIITGGGTGIGRAIAFEYARLGSSVVLASRSPDHLEPAAAELRPVAEKQGGRVLAIQTDVRDPAQ